MEGEDNWRFACNEGEGGGEGEEVGKSVDLCISKSEGGSSLS